MKLETFFEKFDQFADAPNAVARMRELILQLAVRGELVPQNSKDQPVTQAIEKIVSANGSGRPAKLFVDEEGVELPFVIPASWKWVRFGDLVRIRTGKLDANAAVEGGEYPFFTCSKTPSKIATYSFDTSAVILAGNGDFNLKSYSGKFDAYQRTYVIEPQGWELGFCFWLVSAQIKRITDNQRGSAIPYLRLGDIADPLVPFPPLAEQKRIVAKVDELMALCDRLEAQQQEQLTQHAALARASLARFADAPTSANLKFLFHKSYNITPSDLRKIILTLAVQGKLVTQDPNDEPGFKTFLGLEYIGDEGNDDQEKLPPQWQRCTYRSLTSLVTSGSRGWKEFYAPSGSIFIRTQNIKTDRLILDDVAFVQVPERNDGKRAQVKRDDILITITGANVTKAARVESELSEAYVSQHIALTRPRWSPIAPWLHLCFISHGSARGVLEMLAYGDKPGLNLNNIRDLVMPIPPLAEQRRIVAKVEQLMALVDALETQLAASRATATNLLAALVHELTTTGANHAASICSR